MHQPLASSIAEVVSVVIPTSNSSKFLAVAIESAIDQTHSAIEIIVVDDGSSDGTKVICDSYLAVKYIYQSNQGAASARNTGLRASQGSYLVFLDRDDYLFPEAIERSGNLSIARSPLFASSAELPSTAAQAHWQVDRDYLPYLSIDPDRRTKQQRAATARRRQG